MADRYLKVVLTIIAVELLWIGVKDMAPGVAAQAAATPVVITGVSLPHDAPDFLPVGIVGSYPDVPEPFRDRLVQTTVRISTPVIVQQPLQITADRPLKVEADRPLPVENVPYTPGLRPGL